MTTGALNRARVFLCHSSADKPEVRALYRRLADDGFAPWLDEEDLGPGENWELAIRKAVRAADYVVACLSNAAMTRAGYVHKEIRLALDVADEQPEGSIYVIPVRLEDCAVPERLSHLHWVDLFSKDGYARLTRTLRPTRTSAPRSARPPRRWSKRTLRENAMLMGGDPEIRDVGERLGSMGPEATSPEPRVATPALPATAVAVHPLGDLRVVTTTAASASGIRWPA